MIEPKKRKPFLIQEKRYILAQVDVSMEKRVAFCARLGTVPSKLNTKVKNRKDTKKCYATAKVCVDKGRARNSNQSKKMRVCCLRG